ncbi:MAG: caspase family protein [Calditrichaeota bacterium]|nr:MAG: caspase family protein [Calditrichota bacterium]
MKKALCIGINNYPGTANDLNGCLNDANDWQKKLQSFGFETQMLLDSQATRSAITGAFDQLLTSAQAGDVVVFSYSGHGTSVKDTNNDEVDGYDEALYVYDGILLDDQLRQILKKTAAGVHVVVIADSCFSGTVTRIAADSKAKAKYVQTEAVPPGARVIKSFLSEEDMVEILLSGCSNTEYSYDAYINGRYNGAFTANALSVLLQGQTYSQFFTELRKLLPSSSYPQTPQLEGKSTSKARKIFEADTSTPEPEPEPEPEPNPQPNPEPSWWSKYWWVAALVALAAAIIYLLVK